MAESEVSPVGQHRHSRWFYLRITGSRKEAWDAIRGVGKQGGTWCLFVAIDRALSGLDPRRPFRTMMTMSQQPTVNTRASHNSR